jgi:hypothetical protein
MEEHLRKENMRKAAKKQMHRIKRIRNSLALNQNRSAPFMAGARGLSVSTILRAKTTSPVEPTAIDLNLVDAGVDGVDLLMLAGAMGPWQWQQSRFRSVCLSN